MSLACSKDIIQRLNIADHAADIQRDAAGGDEFPRDSCNDFVFVSCRIIISKFLYFYRFASDSATESLEGSGIFGFDTSMRILRIFHQLSRRLDSYEKRFVVFKNAIEKASRSLHTIVDEVSVQGQAHGKYDSKRTKPDDELAVNADQLKELEKLACSKIEAWADDGRLANHRELPSILYRWREWGDPNKVKSYVEGIIKTDEGLVDFITSYLHKIKSQGMGNYVWRINWQIGIKSIAEFIDTNEIEPRLRSIFSSEVFDQLDARKQLGVKTFLDTIDGKIKDDF